jgi:putative hydrolase of the HAD superfamily
MLGKMTYRDLLAIQRARLGLPEGEFEQLMRDVWTGTFDADLLAYIAGLRPRVKTAVVSNAFSGSRRAVQAHVNASVFDVLIFSAEVGLAKPDPAIYRLALDRLGVAPQEAAFVDDLEENVLAANHMGMCGILYQSARQVREAIDALLAAE